MANTFGTGLWRLADPKISITSATSMSVGASMATGHPDFSWSWLLTLGLAMFCMEVAKNAWGDVYDFDSGTDLAVSENDRTAFSGGKRVLVDALLTRKQTWLIAAVFSAGGLILGAGIVLFREPALFWLGTVALFLGWSYHGPPLQFAYRGLGELDVVLIYGPAIAMASYVLMTGEYSGHVIWAAVPLGIFIAAFLWLNEFPDVEADLGAGKRNLVARLGKHRASRCLPLLYFAGLALLAVAIDRGSLPMAASLGALAVLPAAISCWYCWREPDTFHRNRPAQALGLVAFVMLSAGITAGNLLAN